MIGIRILSKNRQTERNVDTIVEQIFNSARGSNLISNTALLSAKEGRVSEFLKDFVFTLDLKKMHKVCEYGHSSGVDSLAGLYFCLKRRELWW